MLQLEEHSHKKDNSPFQDSALLSAPHSPYYEKWKILVPGIPPLLVVADDHLPELVRPSAPTTLPTDTLTMDSATSITMVLLMGVDIHVQGHMT